MVDLDAARLQSVGNIGGTGYYYTNVICVFAMANFVLQLCKTRYLENAFFRHFLSYLFGKLRHLVMMLHASIDAACI